MHKHVKESIDIVRISGTLKTTPVYIFEFQKSNISNLQPHCLYCIDVIIGTRFKQWNNSKNNNYFTAILNSTTNVHAFRDRSTSKLYFDRKNLNLYGKTVDVLEI